MPTEKDLISAREMRERYLRQQAEAEARTVREQAEEERKAREKSSKGVTTCRDCGAMISKRADKCPQCGAPAKKKTSLVTWAVLALFIALFIGLCSIGNRESAPPTSTAAPRAPQEVVSNSAWDGSVYQVKNFLRKNLKDPDSLQFIEWSKVVKNEKGYAVRCKYRAKNSFGGYVVENKLFLMDSSGNVIGATDYSQ